MEGRRESVALMKKAESKLEAARVLLNEGKLEDAVSRAYYAAYNAARAILLLGEEASTHGGVGGLQALDKARGARSLGENTPGYLAD